MENSRERFEEEYALWIRSAAKDIAFTYNQLNPGESKKIIEQSEKYLKEPESVYGREGLDAIKRLVPDNILLLSTDAVVFSQSIFVRMPSIFDYAVALNRRYYLGSWYSIITFNRTYLQEASEIMLRYTLEHELLQKEIFEENLEKEGAKRFTPEEKKKISNETLKKAIEKSGITKDDLIKENKLMLRISYNSPLIPKPFAETALYMYVEKNLDDIRTYAEASKSAKEDELGKKLNSDFKGWIDFSMNAYDIFLSDVKKELNYADYGYA